MMKKTKPFLSENFLQMETIVKNNVKAYINDFYQKTQKENPHFYKWRDEFLQIM